MNPNDPIVTITVFPMRPGSGTNWLVEGITPNGSRVLSLSGERDVVLAGLSVFVESLHGVLS